MEIEMELLALAYILNFSFFIAFGVMKILALFWGNNNNANKKTGERRRR